ncbi:MAG TPA: DUF3667 domain-containing protein [Hymenobacter sp.]
MNDFAPPSTTNRLAVGPPAAEPNRACLNCGFRGAGRFCQHCGQSHDTHRLTLPHLLHEVLHLFTHVEKGFLYTLKELLVRPGDMQRRYLAGQRTRFQKPFSSFFLACTILALGQYAIKSFIARRYGIQDESEGYFRHYFALTQVLLLPVYSFITWLFFRTSKYNYAEVMVVVLYNLSLVLYGILFINALRLLWPQLAAEYIELPLLLLYNIWTYFRLFPEASRWVLIAKALLINTACYLISHVAADLAVRVLH